MVWSAIVRAGADFEARVALEDRAEHAFLEGSVAGIEPDRALLPEPVPALHHRFRLAPVSEQPEWLTGTGPEYAPDPLR